VATEESWRVRKLLGDLSVSIVFGDFLGRNQPLAGDAYHDRSFGGTS
jgi:hypothetical protein